MASEYRTQVLEEVIRRRKAQFEQSNPFREPDKRFGGGQGKKKRKKKKKKKGY